MAAAPAVRFPVFGLVRLLGVAAAAAILVWAVHFRGGMALSSEEDKLLIFNVHPVLMLIGLVVLNGEALLAYKTVPGTKKLKKLVHLALQFLAMFLSSIGLWAVWKFHNETKIDHLYTLHSWLGLFCIIFFCLQVKLQILNSSVQFCCFRGLLDSGPSGTLVDQKVAERLCFRGMYSLVSFSMFLPSPQVCQDFWRSQSLCRVQK